jgi:hypothetical protein
MRLTPSRFTACTASTGIARFAATAATLARMRRARLSAGKEETPRTRKSTLPSSSTGAVAMSSSTSARDGSCDAATGHTKQRRTISVEQGRQWNRDTAIHFGLSSVTTSCDPVAQRPMLRERSGPVCDWRGKRRALDVNGAEGYAQRPATRMICLDSSHIEEIPVSSQFISR